MYLSGAVRAYCASMTFSSTLFGRVVSFCTLFSLFLLHLWICREWHFLFFLYSFPLVLFLLRLVVMSSRSEVCFFLPFKCFFVCVYACQTSFFFCIRYRANSPHTALRGSMWYLFSVIETEGGKTQVRITSSSALSPLFSFFFCACAWKWVSLHHPSVFRPLTAFHIFCGEALVCVGCGWVYSSTFCFLCCC